MRAPFGPLLVFILVAATLLATLYDLAMIGGRILGPSFWWMFP